MNLRNRSGKYCVLGAGTSGLTVAKNLLQLGIDCECLEKQDDVGGNWYYGSPASSVYASTHLISSKPLTEYTDFPMPEEYPSYPHHRQVFAYLQNYARHFGLYDVIRFETTVERVVPEGRRWNVHLADGEVRQYAGLVIANGHNWDPRWPQYPGRFDGRILHSSEYKTPEAFAGQRVLVVGGGNSGCDIAVESAQFARRTFHSLRRGYHFLPKFVWGLPADTWNEVMLRCRFPLALRRWLAQTLANVTIGPPQRWGLPRPDHRLFESHPIINSQMFYHVGHGDIEPKPDVRELAGDRVIFTDGSSEQIDVIVYATGYKISLPFIERRRLAWHNGRPNLFLNVFAPNHDNLFVAGLIQPDSGQWGLVDLQAQLIAHYVHAARLGHPSAAAFDRVKRSDGPDLGAGIRYVRSGRHLLEVEHFSYRRHLKKRIARFRRVLRGTPPPPVPAGGAATADAAAESPAAVTF